MSAKNKILKNLTQAILVRDDPAATPTTIVAAVEVGDTEVQLTSVAGIVDEGLVRLGDGEETELVQVDAIVGDVLTLKEPLTKAHAAAETACYQIGYDLGDVMDGGVTATFAAQSTDVFSAMRRLVYQTLNGYTDISAAFALPGLSLDNLCVAAGMPFAKVTGVGTLASPHALATDGSDFGSEANQSLIVLGVNYGGETVRMELWGIDADYTQVSVNLRRGQPAPVNCRMVAAGGAVMSTNALAYVANITKRAGKGKMFDAISDVGLFGTHGTPLPVTGGAAAVAESLDLGAGAYTAGDWLQIGEGEFAEFHQSAGAAALRTPLLRNHVGDAVKRVAKVSFAGVTEEGLTLALGGQVDPIRLAKLRTSAGLRLGAANVAMTFSVADLSPENFAAALGIPSTDVVSNRVRLGDNIGTITVDGVYLEGVLKDGTVATIVGAGCAQDVSNVAVQLSQSAVSALPIALKPTSALQLFQRAA